MIQRNNSDHLYESNLTICKVRNLLPPTGLVHQKEAINENTVTRVGISKSLLEGRKCSVSPILGGQEDASWGIQCWPWVSKMTQEKYRAVLSGLKLLPLPALPAHLPHALRLNAFKVSRYKWQLINLIFSCPLRNLALCSPCTLLCPFLLPHHHKRHLSTKQGLSGVKELQKQMPPNSWFDICSSGKINCPTLHGCVSLLQNMSGIAGESSDLTPSVRVITFYCLWLYSHDAEYFEV